MLERLERVTLTLLLLCPLSLTRSPSPSPSVCQPDRQSSWLTGIASFGKKNHPDQILFCEIVVFRKPPCSPQITRRREHVFNKRRLKDQINCGVLGLDSSNLTDPDRVVNGQVVQENEIPWQVGTQYPVSTVISWSLCS